MKINVSFWIGSILVLFFVRASFTRVVNATSSVKHENEKASSRQDISYNLDLVNRNGSSALMYSQGNDVINGGFTEWTGWSECSSACGKRSLRSRERYCTNPSPSNGGAVCDGERFQLTLCKVVPCRHTMPSRRSKPHHVIGKFGQWSGWTRCECRKRYQKRYRQCYSHSGAPCLGHRVEKRSCKPKECKIPVAEKSSLVDIDPKQFCGFNPCDISKCLLSPLGSCVSDYKCRPVFFDENNKRVEGCRGERIYISPAQVPQVCKINPCEFTRCLMDFTEGRCVVGTKCQAVYYSAEGRPQKCTAVLKVPPRDVCGYDPCDGEACQDNANARCLVTSKCRPVFVNAFNERIRRCEEEAASKSNRIEETTEEEFEAESDDDEDNDHDGNDDDQEEDTNNQGDDDIGADNDDDNYDNYNRYSLQKHFNDEERSDDRITDDDGTQENDDEEEDQEDVDKDFGEKFANAARHFSKQSDVHETRNKPNANMVENSRNFTNPLYALLNVENGERRSKKPDKKLNPMSVNIQDLVSGKLNATSGVVKGTVKKSMKIVSNKKPTTYFYFETKGKNPKENRQFMVITAQKSKKSSVLSKRNHKVLE